MPNNFKSRNKCTTITITSHTLDCPQYPNDLLKKSFIKEIRTKTSICNQKIVDILSLSAYWKQTKIYLLDHDKRTPSIHSDKDIDESSLGYAKIKKKWYYVKKKCQLNRNFFYLTSTFEKCWFIIIWTYITAMIMNSYCVIKCLNIFKY